jgi:hypothetical protein
MEPKCPLPYTGHVNRMARKRKVKYLMIIPREVDYEDNKKKTYNRA